MGFDQVNADARVLVGALQAARQRWLALAAQWERQKKILSAIPLDRRAAVKVMVAAGGGDLDALLGVVAKLDALAAAIKEKLG